MGGIIENALYSVATPIGNLDDISKRAVEILSNVDVIACEDTRNSSVLMEKYGIKTRLISYHKYSENSRCELFLNYLKEGKSIALITDAGTPLISDPGEILVEEVLKNGFKVIPVVGASAPIALLSAIPRDDEDFKLLKGQNLPRDLGSISICVEKAIEQANEYMHSFEREMSFLFIHGLLHLLGYDHIEKEDEEVMFKLQDEILNALDIRR